MTTTMNKEGTLLEENDFLDKWVTWGLWLMAAIVVIVTVTGLVESYNGLYIWFATHQITGFWADWAPVMLDGIAVVGEIAIFASIARMWEWRSRVIPWCVGILGNAASVAGNVGDKVHFHSIPTDLTAAIPPVVAAIGIIVGLGVLKRVAKDVQIKRAKANAKTFSFTPQQIADQLLRDNQELMRKLSEKPAEVVDISPVTEDQPVLKGLDVLIPPKEQDIPQSAIEDRPVVASTVEPVPVSAETRRAASTRTDRGTIWQTGSFPAVPSV